MQEGFAMKAEQGGRGDQWGSRGGGGGGCDLIKKQTNANQR